MDDTTVRGSLWGPNTYYPPTSMDEQVAAQEIQEWVLSKKLPPGWRFADKCNVEKCPSSGRFHYQFFVHTPQVRKSQVISVLSPAHIELCRNRKAVETYCRKEDTRVATIDAPPSIPNIFEYQTVIAKRWKQDDYEEMVSQLPRKDRDDIAMLYLDHLVAEDIAAGQRGAEWIATNPMWRNAWKKFWRSIIKRENASHEASGSAQGSQGSQGSQGANAPVAQHGSDGGSSETE